MSDLQKPIARKNDLVIQEMADEVLVYDLKTNKAHCLNNTAASIWRICDGENSIAVIREILSRSNGRQIEAELIWLGITQLNDRNLLEYPVEANYKGQTRRDILRKAGLAAVISLPLITSLVAPKAASAGSPCSATCSCTLTTMCTSGTACACNTTTGSFTSCPSNCSTGCGNCSITAGQTNRFTCSSTCT